MNAQREMTLDEWMARLPESHAANRELAALRARIAELEAERDRLREALKDANSLCRSAYQVASRIAVEHGTVTLQTNFGALADKLSESLNRQHAALQEGK